MSAQQPANLEGMKVLVTRPAEPARILCQAIQRAGGEALAFPVLAIQPPLDSAPARARLAAFRDYDWAIFVSRNAVEAALSLSPDLPLGEPGRRPRLAAIGKATAQALDEHGAREVLRSATGSTSEALLALPEWRELAGQRLLIVRGQGGREHLADMLRARGGQVDYAEVYRRVRPEGDLKGLLESWSRRPFDVILLTSGEAMDNLLAMLGDHAELALRAKPVVMSARLAELARERGFQQTPCVVQDVSEAGILATMNSMRLANGPDHGGAGKQS